MSKLGSLIMWNGQPTNLKAVTDAGFQNSIPTTRPQGYLSRAIDEIIMEDRSTDWKGKREFFRERDSLRYVVVGLFRDASGELQTNSLSIFLKDGKLKCDTKTESEAETFNRVLLRYDSLTESERVSGTKVSQGFKRYLKHECLSVNFFNAHFVKDGNDNEIDFLQTVAKKLSVNMTVLKVNESDGVHISETIGESLINESDFLIKDLYEGIEKLQKDTLTETEIIKRKETVGTQMKKLEAFKELLGDHYEETLSKLKKIEDAIEAGDQAGGDKRTFLEALSDL
jgi:hypothetical protein